MSRPAKHSICVLTTTRADYGILRPLLVAFANDETIELRLAVTGTHLLGSFGMTVHEIEEDRMSIDIRIPIFLEENSGAKTMSQVMARTIAEFGSYFEVRRPDLLLVLGDRFETFAVCTAAAAACVPVAHLHGGETTEGAMDECFRHCITKMSLLHFTATEIYRRRVIQLGEAPGRVFNVGALGVENARNTAFLSREDIDSYLGFRLSEKPYVVTTFHPATLETGMERMQVNEMLSAIDKRQDLNFLITKSNADIGGQRINEMLDAFSMTHPNCRVVSSLGTRRYMSALKYAACVMGNSSSGLIEAPSFGIPTINIGDRQRGRIRGESVIDCLPEKKDILRAINTALSEEFRKKAATASNPYGCGKTSKIIYKIIKEFLGSNQVDLKKSFYDVEIPESLLSDEEVN